jgi:amino acid transporter
MLGRAGPAALAAVVILSVVASAAALLLMAPRVYLAMARDAVFPAALARVNALTKAPVRATVLLAAIATLLILLGNFREILAFFMCPTLLLVALSASALFVERRRERSSPGFRSPAYPATAALFVALVVAVALAVAVARPIPALAGFALMLSGLPVYAALARHRAVRRRSGGPR